MQLESRIRRQREFLSYLLEKFKPKCYWCDEVINLNIFTLAPGVEQDPLTIHDREQGADPQDVPPRDAQDVDGSRVAADGLPGSQDETEGEVVSYHTCGR
jgi:hypothetical protein